MIISIILGFGLATLFRKTCTLRGCYQFRGPPMEDIEGKTFKMNDKCYKYDYHQQSCKGASAKIIDFARPTDENS
tara:strand:+ start:194 stop:418 length:225 start_codon:yes stop_codon:yes gene_type:complete